MFGAVQAPAKDFSCEIALLHGESEPYFRTPLVVATTHQLLKFYHAFDLLIVDEVDAFLMLTTLRFTMLSRIV